MLFLSRGDDLTSYLRGKASLAGKVRRFGWFGCFDRMREPKTKTLFQFLARLLAV
jgi:hypothetical protein